MRDFVVTAMALRGLDGKPLLWERGKSLPVGKSNSKIERFIIVGDSVDVFIRMLDGAKQTGTHTRFTSPQVVYTIETADRDVWQADMNDAGEDGARDFADLTDTFYTTWSLNQPIEGWGATVTRIVVDEFGTARVYALPDPGSPAANRGVGLRVTFFPQTGFLLMTHNLPITEWMDLQEEVEDEAREIDDPGDQDDSDAADAEEEEIAAAPDVASDLQASTNGAAHAPESPPGLPPAPPPPAVPGVS